MKEILDDFVANRTSLKFPDKIKGDVHAQAFYGVISGVLSDEVDLSENVDIVSDIAIKVTEIVKKHDTVDWHNNKDIHNRIAQDIDDYFYELENEKGFVVDFDTIDKLIDNVLTVALRRFNDKGNNS